jgi:hypothetical protein
VLLDALVWTIRFEGLIYPFNDTVRRRLLNGITFTAHTG